MAAHNALIVELHVPDFEKVKEFYGAFGFVPVRREPPDPEYLVLQAHGVSIAFWPGNEKWREQSYFSRFDPETKRGFGVEIVLAVEDIDVAYRIAQQLHCVVEELTLQSWGLRDFRVEDPFGYYLRFTQPHDLFA